LRHNACAIKHIRTFARVCSQMSMRDRVATKDRGFARLLPRVSACLAALGALAGCGSAPQDPVTESSDSLTLRGDETPGLRKALTAGTWLVEVRERGVDVRATVQVARQRVELIDSVPRHGVLYEVVSLREPAELSVVLRSDDHPQTRGGATVRIARFRRGPDAEPADIETGYRAWAEAAREQAASTPESWARAADKLNEAILQFEAAGDEQARAGAAYALATLQYSARDDWAAAIRASEIATEAFGSAEDEAGVQNAYIVRAAAEIDVASGLDAGTQRAEQKSLYEVADRRLMEAAEFFIEHKQPARAAYASNLRGVRALNLGADDQAAGHFARALELARTAADMGEQVKALMNLAWAHRLQGQVRQAADEYASLLPLVDAQRQPYYYGVVLNNYGFCLIALGDFDRAQQLHTEALELFTRLGQKSERATQLTALGTLYFRIGDSARALETLRTAIGELEKAADNRALVSTLRIAGNAASSAGQHDLALEYLRRSVAIDSNPHDVSRTRVLIASELRQIGDLRGADAELADSLGSTNKVVQADALAERGRLRLAQDRVEAARADLRAADAAYRELGLEFSRIDTNATLAQLWLVARDVAAAGAAADEAVAIVRRLRVNSANPEWRARFLSTQYAPFEARIAVDLATPATGELDPAWKAFRTADEVRARSLADQLEGAARGRRPADEEWAKLRDVLTAQQLRLEARLQNPQADAEKTLELRREIAQTRARLDEHRARQEPKLESSVRLPEALQQVQKKLPADTLVLAYFVGDGASHAWLLGKDRLQHTTLPGRARLQQAIDATSEHVRGGAAVARAERELATMVLGRLFEGAGEGKLLVIPDGPLNALPFAALPVSAQGSELLLDRFLIGYAPSLALAFAQDTRERGQVTRVAVVSDPVYAPDDRRLPTVGKGGNYRGTREQSPNKLTRLPYSALEASAVREAFGSRDTISLAGFDATRERVLELASQELSVLHFATHAIAREDAPERSALFLSEYSPDGGLDADSQLSTADIVTSGLRARVVVLSGCSTGDGSKLRGEGVLGLTHGFLANGAGAVVASLWPVEDASTARLMREFYRAYRANGNAAQALRAAQLRARESQPDTGVWSSFVVRANGFP
jgi:CHAT domain-containing protein/tetratricopeptide (TPR) repeat protein